MRNLSAAIILFTGMMWGCSKPVFLDRQDVDGQIWNVTKELPFQVGIPEPGTYSLSFHVRFTEAYSWSNLWISTRVEKKSGELLFTERFNIPLSDPEGKPLQGMTGGFADREFPAPLLEQRALPITFKEAGEYTFRLKQEMRDDNLAGVVSMGLELERLD